MTVLILIMGQVMVMSWECFLWDCKLENCGNFWQKTALISVLKVFFLPLRTSDNCNVNLPINLVKIKFLIYP